MHYFLNFADGFRFAYFLVAEGLRPDYFKCGVLAFTVKSVLFLIILPGKIESCLFCSL